MKVLEKYLIAIIFIAIVFVSCGKDLDLESKENPTETSTSELISPYLNSSNIDFDICFQRHFSSTTAFRVQSAAKRTNNANKNNLEFVKVGKIINTNILNLIHKKSLQQNISFIKPFHRMICLGKLVI